MEIKILTLTDVSKDLKDQVSELFKQLSPIKNQIDLKDLLVENNSIFLSCAFEKDKVVGIASMTTYKVISGKKGWIEDVVVDTKYRGKRIGKVLIQKLLSIAKEDGFNEVLLFTESEKVVAQNLYKSLGFKSKDSTIFNLKL